MLAETGARERRLRDLPSRVGVYFVLALGLFPLLGYQMVWQKLTAALGGQGLPCPSGKALRDLRRRIGIAPVRALFEVLAGPAAQPSTPGVRFGRFLGRWPSTAARPSRCQTLRRTAAGWGR